MMPEPRGVSSLVERESARWFASLWRRSPQAPGTCAVDPRVIPLGSYMTIAGLGTCHAEDTGGAIIGYRIDVWVPTVAQAYALTGWYSASWGASPTQQALGSPARFYF